MGIDTTTVFVVFLFMIFIYASYQTRAIKDKTHCTFIRPDTSKIYKWIKAKQRRVEFDGGWYYINPKRRILENIDKGIHLLFPTKATAFIFRWDSSQPLDPTTFENNWETPEARLALNKEEDIRAYSAGNVQAISSKGKQGMLERLMPILMLVSVIIIGYMAYSMTKRMDMLGNAMNVIQQMLAGLG